MSSWKNYQDQHHRPGYIYLIHQAGTNYYKIGLTSNPEKRLKQLQTGSSGRLCFKHLIQCHDMSAAELRLHQRFAAQRIRKDGEWFNFLPGQITDVVSAMNAEASVRQPHRANKIPVSSGKTKVAINRGRLSLLLAVASFLMWIGNLDLDSKPGLISDRVGRVIVLSANRLRVPGR